VIADIYAISILVVRLPDGEELTIWDSKESEFASGLEHRRIFRWVRQSVFDTASSIPSIVLLNISVTWTGHQRLITSQF
jgi:hypothetical protein